MASTRMRLARVLPLLVAALAMTWGATLLPAQSSPARAPGGVPSATAAPRADSAAVLEVVERFHAALAAGDAAAALSLLTDDAVIIENGRPETKQRYATHHLPSRISFARTIQTERRVVRSEVRGDMARVSATGIARHTHQGREVTATGTELVILTRTPAGWKISEIHWTANVPGGR